MTSTSSISGLASGLDTTSLISQLMSLESQPQTLLKTSLTDTKAKASAYRAVNSVLSTLQTAAGNLTKATAWTPVKATSSNTTVSASSTAGATTGQVSFHVDKLAANHVVVSSATWTPPTGATTLTIADADGDTAPVDVALADGATLDDAVKAINAANAGVTATAVNTGNGYRLQLSSTASGADSEFTVTGGPAFSTFTQASDAQLTIGAGGAYSYAVTSTSNTFSDVMAGTTFTVGKQGEDATVSVTSDPSGLASAVSSLVTAANSALSNLATYSDNSVGSDKVLRGDSTLRQLTGQILDAVSYAVGGDGSVATAGIQLTKDGQLTFDSAAFTKAFADDPALAQRLVNGSGDGATAVAGVAQRLLAIATSATDSTTGTLVSLANGKDSEATDIQARIDDWTLRLATRQATLEAQFNAMETALSSLKTQSTWLTSQLASLSGSSSS